ncbi:hypothetical protein L7F22_015577 [Adiantum nelumboides]|nr:hypothetical protein [Adiantum nelumboides]
MVGLVCMQMFNIGVEIVIIAKLMATKGYRMVHDRQSSPMVLFEKWEIDTMGPLPRTANGKLYIVVAIDYMTRWVEVQSVAKVNEKTVSRFVYTHICCRFGTPLEIVCDNGPGFRRGLLTEVCEELKISHRHSTPFYPQSNGLVEKAKGIIAGIIRKMVESKPKR